MNQLIKNVYIVFNKNLEEYNRQRAEKIELAYIGVCQGFYVFAGDWQNLFLIDDVGGIEIYLKDDNPTKITDLEVSRNWDYLTKALRNFNFKKFIKWLYKRNTLVKQINWTNLKTIQYVQKCTSKIEPFDAEFEIDEKTGKICASKVCSIGRKDFYVETYRYSDKPHCIIQMNNERYRLYLPDAKPKTQREMQIIPDFPFNEELLAEKIKDLKKFCMHILSEKREGEGHLRYYETLLLYRAFNPDIVVDAIENQDETIKNAIRQNINIWSFCNSAVKEYAKIHKLNPFKILAEMYDKGYIDSDSRINYQKKEDFINEYSYLCDASRKTN